jgi:uncharacterized protein (TIGR02145 family)
MERDSEPQEMNSPQSGGWGALAAFKTQRDGHGDSNRSFAVFTSFFVLLALIGIGYYTYYQASGATFFNKTLSTADDLENGLVGHWTFDGGDITSTTAIDRSGQGNNGTLTNVPKPTAGIIGQGIRFDSTQSQSITAASAIGDISSDVTFGGWVKPTVSGSGYFFSRGQDGYGDGWSLLLYAKAGAVPQAAIVDSNPSQRTVNGITTLQAGTWYHIIGVRNSAAGSIKIYVNGQYEGEATGSGPNLRNSSVGLRFGAYNAGFFEGTIDDVRIYNRILSATEIQKLYALGEGTKINTDAIASSSRLQSGLVGHWTFDGGDMDWASTTGEAKNQGSTGVRGNVTNFTSRAATPGKLGQALTFDGTDDSITINGIAGAASPIGSGDVTIAGWFKLSSDFSGDGVSIKCIVCFNDSPSTNDIYLKFGNGFNSDVNGALCLGVYDNAMYSACSSQTSWNSGEWHHMVGTYSGQTGSKMYVDGVLVGSNSHVGRGTTKSASAKIGDDYDGGNRFPGGTLDDVRIYNRALSADEVAELYTIGLGSTIESVPIGGGGGPSFVCGTDTVLDADSNVYDTLQIGSQCWMKQNLRVGTRVNIATTQTNNSIIEKWCYSDSDANCTSNNPNQPDGGLYQWNEAMQYSTTPGAQGICPAGWHIPTHDELTTLERSVCTTGSCATDFPYDTTTTGYRGTTEGTKLKPGGSSGFEFNLAGYGDSGSFDSRASDGNLWSSSESGGTAWFRYVSSGDAQVNRNADDKAYGLSVRCLRD